MINVAVRGDICQMPEYKAIIAAASYDTAAELSSMMNEAGLKDITICGGKNFREMFSGKNFDIAAAVLPFEEEFGADAVSMICKTYNISMVVFVPSKVYDEVSVRLAASGAVILPKSVSRGVAVSAFRFAAVNKGRIDELIRENSTLKDMVSEMRLVNRAKCVLIEYLRVSEKDAHRQLQKLAMDKRITLNEAAEDVLKTYEYI